MTQSLFTHLPRLAASILALVILSVGCQKGQDDQVQQQTDSLIQANISLLFAHPQQADSLFAAHQQHLTDSTSWYNIEVYRGTAHYLQGDSLGARKRYAHVLQWCERTSGHELIEGRVWNHIGVNYARCSQFDSSLTCYKRSLQAFTRAKQSSASAISTSINLADLYQRRGDMPQSTYYYRYALFLCDSLKHDEPRTSIFCGLAQIYTDLNDFASAHRFFNRAKPYMNQESVQTQIFYYMTLGNCLYFEKRYPESLTAFQRVTLLSRQSGDRMDEFKGECNLAEVYLMQNELTPAKLHMDKADSLAAITPEIQRQNKFYQQSLKTDLDIAEGRIPLTRDAVDRRLNTSGIHSFRYLMLHYGRLQHYAALQHKWKEAYELRALTDMYADSLRGLQATNHVAELTLRYERDTTLLSQRLALADYKTRNAQQNSIIMGGVTVVLVLGLCIVAGIWLYRRRMQRNLTTQMERITQLRMDVVRNRVSPHYIFNVLNTVLPRLSQHPDVEVPVNLLIDVLRGNLLTSGRTSVLLKDELLLVQRYVQLHQLSKGLWPKVEWEVEAPLAQSLIAIPSMSIQIPVENALKHAFPSPTEESLISIRIHLDEKGKVLHLTVTDNGCGYNPGTVRPTGRDTGTGLRLLTRTIEILNRHNEHQASFTIANRAEPEHGTIMHFTIPTDYQYE